MPAHVRGRQYVRRIARTLLLLLLPLLHPRDRTSPDRAPGRPRVPATQLLWPTQSPQSFTVSSCACEYGFPNDRAPRCRRPHDDNTRNLFGREAFCQWQIQEFRRSVVARALPTSLGGARPDTDPLRTDQHGLQVLPPRSHRARLRFLSSRTDRLRTCSLVQTGWEGDLTHANLCGQSTNCADRAAARQPWRH